jgi:thiamine biosynthesis lipoprotein
VLLACSGSDAAVESRRGAAQQEPVSAADPNTATPLSPSHTDAPDLTTPPPVRADGTILADATMMGTRVSINLWLEPGQDPISAGEAIEAAFAEMGRLEGIASEWKTDSAISRLNRSAGMRAIELPTELIEILQRSKDISQATDGRFDVTFHSVGRLWSFKPGSEPPDAAAIERAVALVDYRAIELEPRTGRGRLANPGMAVGLGAIAKGYIVDAGASLLHERGFHHHIVEGGGDTFVSGAKGAKPWRVGIKNPAATGPRDNAIGWLEARDQAVVTSGNYERYFEYQGRHYTHILDPKTGWPIARESSPQSVTLVAGNAADADGYCTAITVMGSTEGMQFVESKPGLEAVIIDAHGVPQVSSGLSGKFVPNPNVIAP